MPQKARAGGTYVAFHAADNDDPRRSDLKYYFLMQAWNASPAHALSFHNSHSLAAGGKAPDAAALRRRLIRRLQASVNLVLIVTPLTRLDRDWVPWEIEYATDACGLPVICAYPGETALLSIRGRRRLWPEALSRRVEQSRARTLHVPFRAKPLAAAVRECRIDRPPAERVTLFSRQRYEGWGLIAS